MQVYYTNISYRFTVYVSYSRILYTLHIFGDGISIYFVDRVLIFTKSVQEYADEDYDHY